MADDGLPICAALETVLVPTQAGHVVAFVITLVSPSILAVPWARSPVLSPVRLESLPTIVLPQLRLPLCAAETQMRAILAVRTKLVATGFTPKSASIFAWIDPADIAAVAAAHHARDLGDGLLPEAATACRGQTGFNQKCPFHVRQGAAAADIWTLQLVQFAG